MIGKILLVLLVSYILGCLSFAYIITKLYLGKDIRTLGSGNPGFTNALRVLPRPLGIAVFIGDVLKGSIAAYIGQ